VGALALVPANTIVTAAGTNLNQFWSQVEQGLAPDSPLQQLLNQAVSRIQEPLGLNLTKDIFSWVRGEYTLSLVPNPNGGTPDWVFLAQRLPEVDVEGAVENLDNLARERGYSVGSLPLLDTTVTAWTKLETSTDKRGKKLARLEAKVKGVHTTLAQYEIFTTSIEAMGEVLSGVAPSLVESEKFQQAIAALPKDNDGYFYIDWEQSEPLIKQKVPLIQVLELAGKPLFSNLRSLTLSSQGSEKGIRRATVFLKLGSA
jgi:hypothetical protein